MNQPQSLVPPRDAAPTYPFPMWSLPPAENTNQPGFQFRPFYDIEYPAIIKNMDKALTTMGGMGAVVKTLSEDVTNQFGTNTPQPQPAAPGEGQLPAFLNSIELRFRPDDPYCHPINGDFVGVSSLLVRVKRRRRRRPQNAMETDSPEYGWQTEGKILGFVPRAVRFREMADFQYSPDPTWNIPSLRRAMENLDFDEIERLAFASDSHFMNLASTYPPDPAPVKPADTTEIIDTPYVPPLPEGLPDPAEILRQVPPPIFSFAHVPRGNALRRSKKQTQQLRMMAAQSGGQNGETANANILPSRRPAYRFKTMDPNAALGDVPTTPPELIKLPYKITTSARSSIEALFAKRPVCTRLVAHNLLGSIPPETGDVASWRPKPSDRKYIKELLPLVAYAIPSGPFKDCWVRYGYDPREHKEARLWQPLETRFGVAKTGVSNRNRAARFRGPEYVNPDLNPATRYAAREETEPGMPVPPLTTHLFDGVSRESVDARTATFQLCDIVGDSELRDLVLNNKETNIEYDNGWYPSTHIDAIRQKLKDKVLAIHPTGGTATEGQSEDAADFEDPTDPFQTRQTDANRSVDQGTGPKIQDKGKGVAKTLKTLKTLARALKAGTADERVVRAAEEIRSAEEMPNENAAGNATEGSSSRWQLDHDGDGDFYDEIFGEDEDGDESPDEQEYVDDDDVDDDDYQGGNYIETEDEAA
ncbi:hypothetical protein M427DRAFT_31198 [Gonapodya prolifera JEL478]|uniref:Transcription factor IIIC subunit 5 HTH domain-containing protein n=1 Tax=Gonapodya prolifera (strain JEL478) TaxID=1344416 RepID=A0A139AIE7_GONPJ|nr:hypothetical protein M427DRAFT_31198 [Gonapodya prolifera JEL478]|eukprot:KXS16479.1 hypothetical protein M427DRAFT_31198 [Gonapodya prolifera JEL478]